MKHWSEQRIAGTAGAELVRGHPDGRAGDGPTRVVIDSREVQPGDLFVGIPGEHADGGEFAAAALAAGAWGVIVTPPWLEAAAGESGGAIIASDTPVPALGALARAWRRDLAAHVIAITGSVGKTSTKDLTTALIAPHRAVASNPKNWNTEIGLPLAVLAAPLGTEVLVLEMGMRGFGQIAELVAICEPDVGVITNIGPVHLEQMGSLEGMARAKAELLEGLYDGATAVVPSDEPLLEPWLRDALEVVTFGPGGDVAYEGSSLRGVSVPDAVPLAQVVLARGERIELELPFDQAHNLLNTLAAVAAALAVGVTPGGLPGRPLLRPAGRARAARHGRHRHQRLLQRQPAVHARRPRRPRDARVRRTAHRRAGRHARARAGRGRAPPRHRRLRRHRGGRRAGHGRQARGADARPLRRRGLRRRRRRARRPRWPASCWRPATCCWSRARAGVGLEVVAEALAAGEGTEGPS